LGREVAIHGEDAASAIMATLKNPSIMGGFFLGYE
jgi:hypothetical protein